MTDKVKSKQSKRDSNIHYVNIDELPDDQREPFRQWLAGQTQPVVEEEPPVRSRRVADTAYFWDYSLWYDYASLGEIAPVED